MGRIHYKEEQVIAKLRKTELLFAEGKNKAQVLTEKWKREYNTIRPHSSLAYKAPLGILPSYEKEEVLEKIT